MISFIFKINLNPTCACVTCSAYQNIINTGKFSFRKSIILHIEDVHISECLQCFGGIRTLYRQQTSFVGYVVHLYTTSIELHDPFPVFFNVGCIHNQHVYFVLLNTIHQHIIHNSSIFIGQTTVLCLSVCQFRCII